MRFLRIARGVLGTAITWSVPWAIAGGLLRIFGPAESPNFPSLSMLASSALTLGVAGALLGSVFAMVLAVGGERLFARLNYRRIAALGATVPVVVSTAILAGQGFDMPPELIGYFLGQTAVLATLSAGCAFATLWGFRRGPTGVDLPEALGIGSAPEYSTTHARGERVTR